MQSINTAKCSISHFSNKNYTKKLCYFYGFMLFLKYIMLMIVNSVTCKLHMKLQEYLLMPWQRLPVIRGAFYQKTVHMSHFKCRSWTWYFLFFWFFEIVINQHINQVKKTDLNNKPCIRLYQIQKSKATIHLPYNTWLLITNHSCGQYAVDLKLNLKSHEASVGLSDMFIFCKTVWLITEMWQQT